MIGEGGVSSDHNYGNFPRVTSQKKRRLTLLECNNDINSMIDVAKIADLVSTWNLIIIFFNLQPCTARFSNIIIFGCLFGVLSLLYSDFPNTNAFVVIFISGSSAD